MTVDVALKAGDTFTVIANYGAKAPNLKGMVFPAVGELTLAPAGTPVAVGYDYQLPEAEEVDPNDPLSGKTILWIGSSVTYGAQSGGHGILAAQAACGGQHGHAGIGGGGKARQLAG